MTRTDGFGTASSVNLGASGGVENEEAVHDDYGGCGVP